MSVVYVIVSTLYDSLVLSVCCVKQVENSDVTVWFLVQIYLCNQTVCKYRCHNARWFVVLISVHMLMQVCINVSVAVALSFGFDLMAKTFRQLSPILNPEIALSGELSSVRVLYRVGEKFRKDSMSFSFSSCFNLPFMVELPHAP